MKGKKVIKHIEAWSYEQERKADSERNGPCRDQRHLCRLEGMILILNDLRHFLEALKNTE